MHEQANESLCQHECAKKSVALKMHRKKKVVKNRSIWCTHFCLVRSVKSVTSPHVSHCSRATRPMYRWQFSQTKFASRRTPPSSRTLITTDFRPSLRTKYRLQLRRCNASHINTHRDSYTLAYTKSIHDNKRSKNQICNVRFFCEELFDCVLVKINLRQAARQDKMMPV